MFEKKKEVVENIESSITDAEKERIKRDIYRPDIEKFRLFTRMLRRNALLNNAKIIHK